MNSTLCVVSSQLLSSDKRLLLSHVTLAFTRLHCLKKLPIIKLSVTLSNLNRFSKLVHCWKAYKIWY